MEIAKGVKGGRAGKDALDPNKYGPRFGEKWYSRHCGAPKE